MAVIDQKVEGSNPLSTFITYEQLWYETQHAPKTFEEKLEASRQEYRRTRKKYRRGEACKLIGFPGSTPKFSAWLKDNYFLSDDDSPHICLHHEDLMNEVSKAIYGKPKYDSYGGVVRGTEDNGSTIIKYVYTPLFTDKGIAYFKKLLADPLLLKEEAERLKEHNRISELCLKGIFEPDLAS